MNDTLPPTPDLACCDRMAQAVALYLMHRDTATTSVTVTCQAVRDLARQLPDAPRDALLALVDRLYALTVDERTEAQRLRNHVMHAVRTAAVLPA